LAAIYFCQYANHEICPYRSAAASLLASANDGIGAVSAGGIVFGKTDAIAMKKEVLTSATR
jgi:hypothetical protein